MGAKNIPEFVCIQHAADHAVQVRIQTEPSESEVREYRIRLCFESNRAVTVKPFATRNVDGGWSEGLPITIAHHLMLTALAEKLATEYAAMRILADLR